MIRSGRGGDPRGRLDARDGARFAAADDNPPVADPDEGQVAGSPRSPATRLLGVERGELGVLALSTAYFFCLLSGYYIMRPFRDAMGAAGGVDQLKWLYLGTLGSMLVASAAFGAVAARWGRGAFIPWVYRFFILNIAVFFVLLRSVEDGPARVWLGRVFFVWVSVFNLFVVSVFWSFMADVFTSPQGKRLFGVIAVGGTLGQIGGSFGASRFAEAVGAVNLLVVSALLLEAACWCAHALNAIAEARRAPAARAAAPIGGGALAGARRLLESPYLAGIALFVFCYTITSTFLNVTKLDVGSRAAAGEDARVRFFAAIDFWTGVATIAAQVLLTGRLMSRFGVGLTLAVLPGVTLAGFLALSASFARPDWLSVVVALTVFEALRRASNYAVSRPAREVLYTVVGRQDKYKSKNFIDTFVYRAGDQVGVWAYAGLAALEAGGAVIAIAATPVAAGWLVLAGALGRRQRELSARSS